MDLTLPHFNTSSKPEPIFLLKENQRQKKESFWICELQTLHTEGINKKA
jgi:hypothetical protein